MGTKTLYLHRNNCTLFDQVHNQLFVLLGSYVMIRLSDMICHVTFSESTVYNLCCNT